MKLSDEKLMAYADGELPEEEVVKIEKLIQSNPDLKVQIDEFIQTKNILRDVYRDVISDPIPQHFLDTIEQNAPANTPEKVIALKSKKRFEPLLSKKPIALAASVALVVGLLIGQLISTQQQGDFLHQLAQADAGFVVAGNPLHEALETTPSHNIYHVDTAIGDIIVPIMSFKAKDERYCREFEINADSFTSMGVACRVDQQWQVEVLLAAERRPQGDLTYRPATGYSEAALNAVLDKLWSGEAFDIEQESSLIANNWRR